MTVGTGVISSVSVSKRDASVEELEAASVESQRATVDDLLDQPGVEEAFVLQTCNRTEAYVVTADVDLGRAALSRVVSAVPREVVTAFEHEESLRHLMRVAAGLESLVVGEDQILGQVRDAYEDARGVGGIGPRLDEGVTKAIHVGERARSETAINEGATSLASAAVRLASDHCDVEGETALIVGAGEMGQLAAKNLDGRVDQLLVANRTVPHAEHVADSVEADASAIGMDALHAAVEEARVVVSATGSPNPVFEPGAFVDAGETVVVDMAQPRDVPETAADREGVTLLDLDELEALTERTRENRRAAAKEVEAMIDAEFDHLLSRYKRKRADDVISTMYESAERVKAREMETAMEKLDGLDDEQREVVEAMADAIVNQLLAAPTKSLRDAAEDDDWSTINTALRLFDPEFGPETDQAAGRPGPEAMGDVDPAEIPEDVRERMPDAIVEQLED